MRLRLDPFSPNGVSVDNSTITVAGGSTTTGGSSVTVTGEDYLSLAAQEITANPIDLDNLSATGTPSGSTFLRGDNTWATPAGSGDVSKVGTPVNDQIGVWTGDGTIEGDANLTFDTTTDTLTTVNIAPSGTVDGRDVATDGTKLDGVETGADVTDTANVTSAGALMDSELTSIVDVKALNQSVVSGASPVFATTNMTEGTDKNFVTDAEAIVIGNTSGVNTGDQDLSGLEHKAIEVTSTTARTTAAKVGTTTGGSYSPTYGDVINVTFTLGIAVATPTLNIDGSGAKNIKLDTTNVSTTLLSTAASSTIIPLWYDGTAWQMYGSHLNTDTNTTYIESTTGSAVTTTPKAVAVNNLYYANYSGVLAFTLPTTAALNSVVEVIGQHASGTWTITAASGDNIIINGNNTGAAGVLTGAIQSTVKLRCILANTTWEVTDYTGVITTNTGYSTATVPTTTTVNGHALSGNVTVTASDVGAPSGSGTSSGTNTGDQTNISGNAATVTTNANLTGPITSVGNTTSIASQTGTGSTFVVDTSPTLVTPSLGVASATSINKVTITAPTSAATLTLIDGSSLITAGAFATTLTSTATTNVTLPTTGTLATLAGTETLSGKTLTAPKLANGGFIADANGNEEVIFTTTASAVNELTVANAATTGAPTISATGGDTNISINLVPKGTGAVKVATEGAALQLVSDGVTSVVATNSPGSKTITLPGATSTVVGRDTTDTLTNKNLTSATNTMPTNLPTHIGNQADTTNTTPTSVKIQTGWGFIAGNSTGANTKAVTFPTAFTTILTVVISPLGFKSGSDPTTVGDFSGEGGDLVQRQSPAATTSGFTARIAAENGRTLASSTIRYGFSWIAYGT